MEEGKEMCCVCARNGKASKLKTYQINFEEAIRFCEDDECTYPVGMDNSSWVLNRKFSELQVSKPSVLKRKSLPQQTHHAPIKTPDYNHETQKNVSKSSLCRRTAPVKSKLYINQDRLKNGQNTYMQGPSSSSTKTRPTLSARNNSGIKPWSPIPSPVFQLSTEGVKQNTDIVTPTRETGSGTHFKPITLNKSEKNQNTSKFDAARQTTIVKGEKYCPSTIDQLRAFYPQWQNKDALCWMDVILCLLVHCKQVNKLQRGDQDSDPSIVCTLLKAYDQALSLLNKRSTSNATSSPPDVVVSMTMPDNATVKSQISSASTLLSEETAGTGCNDEDKCHLVTKSVGQGEEVKTGAGLKLLKSDFLQLMSSHSDSEYSKAFDLLGNVREKIWHLLHPRLRCKKGKNDSPVFAIPLLTKNSKDLEQLLAIKYSFHFSCDKCGFRDVIPYQKVLPTFPNTIQNFSMKDPKFLRPCFQCHADGQPMTMLFERLPPVLMLHFQEGLHNNNFSGYDFQHQDQLYQVTGVIQYRNDPDHFIAWIRNPKVELWMECNDLKSPVCQFDQSSPSFPASQVHIMMWEAVNLDDVSKVTVQNGKDSCSNGPIEVSMETSVWSEGDLMSFVTGKGDAIHSVTDNNVVSSTPVRLVSLSSQNSVKRTPIGDYHSPTDALTRNGGSKVNYNTPVKNMATVVNVPLGHKVNIANIQKPAEMRRLGTVNGSVPLGAKNNLVPAHTGVSPSDRSAHPDKILEKTKNHVSFLRNMRNPRLSRASNDSRGQQKVTRIESLPGQGSLNFLTRILGNSNTKPSVSPVMKGKVFEGYKSKMVDATNSFASKNRTKSASYEVDTESLSSRPNSPALSCHSDSFVIQKRKSDNDALSVLKRRKSQDTNFTSARMPVHSRSLSLDTASTPTLVSIKPMNGSRVETTTNGSQCNNNELLASASMNDCTFQESDILQNLYSALNIAMPATTDDSKSPVKAVAAVPMDVENIPDISDLDNFINSSCDSSMEDNFDDFLSEL